MFPTNRIRAAMLATTGTRISPAAANRFAWRAGLRTLVISAFLLGIFVAIPASADEDENYKVVQGLGVYLGVLPAGLVRGHPESHPEAAMHGGAPLGAHDYHVIIAIFDAATGARVENAKVTADVSGLGHVGGRSVELAPMTISGTVTYGNFVTLPGNDLYDIRIDITVPGRDSPAQAEFYYQHPR